MEIRQIKQNVAENKLQEACEALTTALENQNDDALFNQGIALQARLEQLEKDIHAGTLDYGDYVRMKNMLSYALLDLIDRADPESSAGTSFANMKGGKGMSELRIKWILMIMLAIAKFVLLVFLIVLWQSGGFSKQEFYNLLGILVPIFATYLYVAVKNIVKDENQLINRRRRSSRILTLAFFLLTAYVVVLASIVYFYLLDSAVTFTQLTIGLTAAEAFLGVMLGEVIYGIYQKEDS